MIQLTAPSLQTYSRAVTEQIVMLSRRLRIEFSVSKWLKLTDFHLLTPLLKKATSQWENQQEVQKTSLKAVKIYFCAFRNWKSLHNYHRPTMKIPELRWCLTKICLNNPS